MKKVKLSFSDFYYLANNSNTNQVFVDENTDELISEIDRIMSALVPRENEPNKVWIEIPVGIDLEGGTKIEWLAVSTANYEGRHWLGIDNSEFHWTFLFDPQSQPATRTDMSDVVGELRDAVSDRMSWIIADVNGYNCYVEKSLPYEERVGKIRRSDYYAIYPDERLTVSAQDIELLRTSLDSTEGQKPESRLKTMTLRVYLSYWRVAYEAFAAIPHDESLRDEEFSQRYNPNAYEFAGMDADSEETFAAWYANPWNIAYHKYELMYRSVKLFLEKDEDGWWFYFQSHCLSMMASTIRVTRALSRAGAPVGLAYATKMIEILREADYIGIQSGPAYRYDTIYKGEVGSYVSLGDEKDAEVIAKALWKPVSEIVVI